MKNCIALLAAVVAFLSGHAQVDDSCHERHFHDDVRQMYVYIETLNKNTLLPLDSMFRKCDSNRTNGTFAGNLYGFIRNAIDSIKRYDTLVTQSDFYKGRRDCHRVPDTSYLYYYTRTEMDDYIYSLRTLILEMKGLLPDDKSLLNTFHNANFLSAYYYMCQSRSMLMATMDNLAHYCDVNGVAQIVRKRTDELPVEFARTKGELDRQREDLERQKEDLGRMEQGLNNIWKDRKNWWWRTLIGGCAGGLVAGLIVHAGK
jgi:hypothetical protein